MSAILESVLDDERRADCARNDESMGIPHVPGQWSPQWAKAETAYYRRMALSAGECPDCGERGKARNRMQECA